MFLLNDCMTVYPDSQWFKTTVILPMNLQSEHGSVVSFTAPLVSLQSSLKAGYWNPQSSLTFFMYLSRIWCLCLKLPDSWGLEQCNFSRFLAFPLSAYFLHRISSVWWLLRNQVIYVIVQDFKLCVPRENQT